MTESFIESAMMALTGAWNNDTVIMSCQPLSEALNTVAQLLAEVRNDVRGLQDVTTHLRGTTEKLEEDSLHTRSRLTDIESKLVMLTTDTHGFVQRPELLDRVGLLKTEVLAAARIDHDRAMAQIDSLHTNMHETISATQRNRDNHEHFRSSAEHQLDQLRAQQSLSEDNWRQKHEEHRQLLETQLRTFKEYQAQMGALRTQDAEALNQRFEHTVDKAALELQAHSDDTLAHLKEQSEEIAQLKRQLSERIEATPSRHEVDELVKRMEASRLSVDEAQYRLTETFSQCMAMMGSSATGGGGAGGASFASSVMSGGASPSATRKHATSSAAERVLASLRPSAGATTLLGAVPVGMEVQIETLRQDMRSLQEDVVPRCLDRITALGRDVDAVNGAVVRAESLGGSLVECLSLGDGDELRASLLARDHHKTIVLLRRAFNVLASSKFTLGSNGEAARSSSPTTTAKKKSAGASSTQHSIAVGGDAEGSPRKRDGATTSIDADEDDPAGSTTFVPPSVWDQSQSKGQSDAHGDESEDDAAIRQILTQYRAPPLGLDLADAVGGTLGANVMLVGRDSVAATHGVAPGDRIIKVNGERCDNCSAFVRLLTMAVRRAVINHHAKGLPSSRAPALLLELTVIPSRGHATRHITLRARLQLKTAHE